jgi:tetratricopeptide (TPR) repeat protein
MAWRLLLLAIVDASVIRAAGELYTARQFPGVVAACTEALEDEPGCTELRLLRARSLLHLRRDVDAQLDLREVIRFEPKCAIAYRLLGELAARREELESARIFLQEAVRLDPDDHEAKDWLAVVQGLIRPAAAPDKLPATGAAAGASSPKKQALARGSDPQIARPRAPAPSGVVSRTRVPEGPGFGPYLIEIGLLTPDRLKAAEAYQRSMNVKLSVAVVALGLASPLKVEWASLAFHGADSRAA